MTNHPRDTFLKRVKAAVRAGNRRDQTAELPNRGQIGYQGCGSDPVEHFREQWEAAGGVTQIVEDAAQAVARVMELVEAEKCQRILLGSGPPLDALRVEEPLRAAGKDVILANQRSLNDRDCFFDAELSISGVRYLVAETGTLVVAANAQEPRSSTLVPPVHIAVACRQQILPDLFDCFVALEADGSHLVNSGISLITGPSKTGDIELKLVTGVHGPGRVTVVLMRS